MGEEDPIREAIIKRQQAKERLAALRAEQDALMAEVNAALDAMFVAESAVEAACDAFAAEVES